VTGCIKVEYGIGRVYYMVKEPAPRGIDVENKYEALKSP